MEENNDIEELEEMNNIEELEEIKDKKIDISEFLREVWKILFRVFIGVVAFVIVMLVLRVSAQKIGENFGSISGEAMGKLVGTAVGSSDWFQKGKKDGKEKGLSAADTVVEIQSSFQEVANLEVLVSSVKLNDYHKLEEKYAALYLLKGDAVFTVDLSKASIDVNEDGKVWHIRVPQPEATIYIDERYTEKVVEYQRKFFNGSAEDGFNAYVNSMSNLEMKARDAIEEDESLMKCAKDSAERQIKMLVKLVLVNGEEPLIIWE